MSLWIHTLTYILVYYPCVIFAIQTYVIEKRKNIYSLDPSTDTLYLNESPTQVVDIYCAKGGYTMGKLPLSEYQKNYHEWPCNIVTN